MVLAYFAVKSCDLTNFFQCKIQNIDLPFSLSWFVSIGVGDFSSGTEVILQILCLKSQH